MSDNHLPAADAAPAVPPAESSAPAALPEQGLVWALFLCSGACALIYEVLWCRQLGLILGNTVHSLSAVLTAFMGGLALGSYVAGRLARRLRRPLLVYGVLELLIGLCCAALPWFLSDHGPLVPLYRSLYGETGSGSLVVARFAISFALMLAPATFMGATLPVLSQHLVRSRQFFGKTVGMLYAVNTFGAVVGAAATGFILLPLLGKASTNWIAVSINLLLGVLAISFGLRGAPAASAPLTDPEHSAENSAAEGRAPQASPRVVKLAVLTFGVTGFAAMATQIAWTRAISLAIGSSTYAFSLIVSVFILGLSGGGMWGARAAARTVDPVAALAKVLLLIGLFGAALAALLGYGPLFFFVLIARGQDWSYELLLAAQAACIGVLILIPSFLMGATMPLTMQIAARFSDSPGRTVGTIYAVNTLGAILGSFLGGLLLLPLLQLQTTLNLMALLYAVPGVVLFWNSPSRREKKSAGMVAVTGAALLLIVLLAARWDPRIMSSGMYLARQKSITEEARRFQLSGVLAKFRANREILYYREGASATVAVTRLGGQTGQSGQPGQDGGAENPDAIISLSVGGKPDASTGTDMSTQVELALVPCLLHTAGAEDVLVIGLGSGVTAGAALAPASVKHVDAVEMTPEVVEASSFFRHKNRLPYVETPRPWIDTQKEPRISVLVNDGRNHLLLTRRKYDVISSEPSNPWMAGVGNLFTKEAFELSRRCLKPGGIMCQWIHCYSLEDAHFYSIARTFGEVYPHVCLWWINQYDLMLLGSDKPFDIPLPQLRERLAQPAIKSWLADAPLDDEHDFLAKVLAHNQALREKSAPFALHTDDNMLLEFAAPRALHKHARAFNPAEFPGGAEEIVRLDGVDDAARAAFLKQLDLASASLEHTRFQNAALGHPLRHQQLARLLSPRRFRGAQDDGSQAAEARKTAQGDSAQAQFRALLDEARLYLALGDGQRAMLELDRLAARADLAGAVCLMRAQALALQKEFARAREEILKAPELGVDPSVRDIVWVTILRDAGRYAEAVADLAPGLVNTPQARNDKAAAPLWALLAEAFDGSGNLSDAAQAVAIARRLTDNPTAALLLPEASILAKAGKLQEALLSYRQGAAFDADRFVASASVMKAADAFADPSRAARVLTALEEIMRTPGAWDGKINAPWLALLGHLRAGQGQLDEAQAAVAKARQLEPRDAAAALIEARIQTRRGKLREAAECHRLRAALEPFNADAAADVVHAFIASGNASGDLAQLAYARRVGTSLCQLRPGAAQSWELLAKSFEALAKADPAHAAFYTAQAAAARRAGSGQNPTP
jgi:spermidine synthase